MDFDQMKRMETASRIGFACVEAAGSGSSAPVARDRMLFVVVGLTLMFAAAGAAIMGA
ncbi:MAG: hypothetical protein AB7O39_12680 [Flavobacteriaceae bacterium]